MKNPPLNGYMPRIFKSALLRGLLILVGTAALAQSSSDAIEQQQNPIQSFSANPSTITAGQTTTLSWVVEGAENVTLSGLSATPVSSAVVARTHTTTYTLTATRASGKRVSQEVIVNVAADTSIATATIDPTQPGNAIAPGFLGFSHEYSAADGVPAPAPVRCRCAGSQPSSPQPIAYFRFVRRLDGLL